MKNCKVLMVSLLLLMTTGVARSQDKMTSRTDELSNNRVKVWKTIIYPSSGQVLAMHRHEHDRVVVALTDGVLKITNDKGKVHYFKLKKDKAYYLARDVPNELHNDENISDHPVKVMVIELNDNA